jgi:serine/threonine protein kinase
VLGKGNFGEVSKGLLTETPGMPGYLVAVKVLHSTLSAESTALLEEAAVMAQFDSPRIVGLVGVVTVDAILVIIEYCEHGALNRYLETHELSVTEKYRMAADCAEGLAYLASMNFVHRDVAARNVLVSSERRGKISDFGLSRDTSASEYYRSKGGQVRHGQLGDCDALICICLN